MRQLFFRASHLSLLVFFVSLQALIAKQEYVRTYEQSYSLSADGKVDIENRYGQVQVKTWAKNEVSFKVSVRVNTASESKAESTFDRIKINFDKVGNVASAETEIDSKKSFWNILQRFWGDADLSIDYEVFMPETADLELENKYGDSEVASLNGHVTLDIKYGNFTLDHAAEDLLVNLGYGNGVVAQANRASVDLSYGKIRINDANTLDIDSKFSKVTVESANQIISDSKYDGYDLGDIGVFSNDGKYDNIKIDQLEELTIETSYTKVEVNELTIKAYGRFTYGGLQIDNVAASVEGIDVEGKYTGIEIDLAGLPQYRLQADTKYTKMHAPQGLEITKRMEENNETYVEGFRGSQNSPVRIRLTAHYGGLRLR